MAQIDDDDITIVSRPSQSNLPAKSARYCPKCGLAVADATSVCPQDGTQIFEAQEELLADKYEFITVTGSGGMSVVYKARRHDNGEIVAIKMMHSLLMNDHALKRFQQEAKAITSLRHPNIITVHDFGVSEHGQPYMVMDFIEGNTLADVIKEKGGLTLDESLHRFIQLCDALEHAHEVGVLHRDLKPSNIMISNRDGNFADARIVDFGIAKLLDKEDENNDASHLTRTGELFGSPLYMSPEQCRGSKLDARTDIYSMGCVMYETLTGQPPLRGGSMVETFVLQMSEVPLSMAETCPGKNFPDELEAVIAKALAKDPDDRFQSMTELEFALMQIQPNQSSSSSNKAKHRQNKTLLLTALPNKIEIPVKVVVVVALLGTTASILSLKKTPQPVNLVKSNQTTNSAPEEKIDIADLAKRNRMIRKEMTGGDDTLISALSGGDLGMSRVDLSKADPPIHDKSGVLLGKLKSLEELNLNDNKIGDETLYAIEKLPLERLEVSRTNVTDRGVQTHICNHMGNTLKALALTGCKHVGSESIRTIGDKLQKLESLHITKLVFDDQSFANLKKLSLHHLYAEQTPVSDDGISALSDMTSLTKLKLNYTTITDRGISYLTKLTKMRELELTQAPISDKGIALLANLKNLEKLDLGYTTISAQGLASLAPLKSLQSLYLYNTKLGDEDLASLANFPELNHLDLADGIITDRALDTISKLSSLRWLDIGGNRITDKGLQKLAHLHQLETLILYNCPVTLDGVRKLQKSNPELLIRLLNPHDSEGEIFWKDPRNFKYYPDS